MEPYSHIQLYHTFNILVANDCTSQDYYKWSPSDNLFNHECILGEKETFERKIANHLCRNGGEYERDISKTICNCSREDFEWYIHCLKCSAYISYMYIHHTYTYIHTYIRMYICIYVYTCNTCVYTHTCTSIRTWRQG